MPDEGIKRAKQTRVTASFNIGTSASLLVTSALLVVTGATLLGARTLLGTSALSKFQYVSSWTSFRRLKVVEK